MKLHPTPHPFSLTGKLVHWGPVALVALVCVIVAACRPGQTHTGYSGVDPTRPECPHDWDSVPLFKPDGRELPSGRPIPGPGGPGGSTGITGAVVGTTLIIPAGGLSVPGPRTDIPEFHDCQRFITDDGANYEPLFAVFASARLDSITGWMSWDSTLTWTSSDATVATVDSLGKIKAVAAGTANVVARSPTDTARQGTIAVTVHAVGPGAPLNVSVTPGGTTPLSMRLDDHSMASINLDPLRRFLAAAEIYTYGPGYEPLGIGPNFSCLLIYPDAGGHIVAKMVKAPNLGVDEQACLNEIDPDTAAGKMLSVRRLSGAALPEYPEAARWDRDTVNNQYFVGVACGDGWCEVGAGKSGRAFSPPPPYSTLVTGGPNPGPGQQRVLGIKGWYDEQFLAVIDAAGVIKPSRVKGTFIPDPNLATYDDAAFQARWQKTGYVGFSSMTSDPTAEAYYKAKFGLLPVQVSLPLNKMNMLYMCHGSMSDCHIPNRTELTCKVSGWERFQTRWLGKEQWWVRVIGPPPVAGAPTSTSHRCVIRRPFPTSVTSAAATARWRWLATDETGWEECTQGCCEIQSCNEPGCQDTRCEPGDTECQNQQNNR